MQEVGAGDHRCPGSHSAGNVPDIVQSVVNGFPTNGSECSPECARAPQARCEGTYGRHSRSRTCPCPGGRALEHHVVIAETVWKTRAPDLAVGQRHAVVETEQLVIRIQAYMRVATMVGRMTKPTSKGGCYHGVARDGEALVRGYFGSSSTRPTQRPQSISNEFTGRT